MFTLGMTLALLYAKSRSLLPCVLLHATYNLLCMLRIHSLLG